jgi:L-rhamnose mutarotase
MRVAMHSVIRTGSELDYEREHERIPAELAARFAQLGIRDWTIWRSGLDLFHLVECDDFASAIRALDDDPANVAWQERIGRYVDHFVLTGEGPEGMPIRQVWRLSEQADE